MGYADLHRMRPTASWHEFTNDLDRLGLEVKDQSFASLDFIWFLSEADLNLYKLAGKYSEINMNRKFSVW